MRLAGKLGTAALEVRLVGGLGNQLFQFFAALRQSIRLNCDLHIFFDKGNTSDTSRELEIEFVRDLPNVRITHRSSLRRTFQEKTFRFDPKINQVVPGTRLTGYFQSWKYFENQDCLEVLGLSDQFRSGRLFTQLQSFIAVHIRRGDYEREPAKSYHGLFSSDYYAEALSLIRRQTGNLPAIIFSDCEHCAKILCSKLQNATVFDPPNQCGLFTLGAMSNSAGFAMSNSSFSWWGAEISLGNSSHVVAPRPWFKAINVETVDLLRPEWLCIGDPAAEKSLSGSDEHLA